MAIANANRENEDLKRKLLDAGHVTRKVSEYEERTITLSQEIERLNALVRNKGDDYSRL